MFKNKIILITGGTGSFGYSFLVKLLKMHLFPKEIRIFSRDEKKQDDMRKKFNLSKLKFIIGDVRDKNSLDMAVKNVDYIFHAAALKQVPSCEFYPMEALKTNVLGTENLLNSAIENKVKKVICLSTDKAVYPINAMGISKALMEKNAISKSLLKQNTTTICVTRYGNVMGSRGSVIPLFIDKIKKNKALTITDKNMTRFMMTMDDALNLVLFAFKNGKNGELFVKKTPSASLDTLSQALIKSFSLDKKYPIKIIGTRHGEKIHETLLNSEEMSKARVFKDFFRVKPDLRNLNYDKYYTRGKKNIIQSDYTSSNAKKLNVTEMYSLIRKSRILD